MPDKSPLTSAANTGTPAREKPSASTCSVTVLPVPVAPVTSPCRLASESVSTSGLLLLPTKMAVPSSIQATDLAGAFAAAALLDALAAGFGLVLLVVFAMGGFLPPSDVLAHFRRREAGVNRTGDCLLKPWLADQPGLNDGVDATDRLGMLQRTGTPAGCLQQGADGAVEQPRWQANRH